MARLALPCAASLSVLLLFSCASVCAHSGAIRDSFPEHVHNPLQLWAVHATRTALDNGITLSVNTTVFEDSGHWVKVSWAGVPGPSYDDMVALYVPADASPTATTPAKFKWAARAEGYIQTGAGSASFRLVNMRADVRFAFVRNGLDTPLVAATSDIVAVARPNAPQGVHLALTGSPGEMLVQWSSRDGRSPVVRWGAGPGGLDSSAGGASSTYTPLDMCGGAANSTGWVDPGMLHRVVVTGLEPGTTYRYTVGDQALGEFSSELSFVAPPAPGAPTLSFIAIADMGQAEPDGSNEMTEMVAALRTQRLLAAHAEGRQLLLHNGDISYAMGFSTSWDVYFEQLQPLASAMPYMSTIGNHERDWPASGDVFDGAVGAVTDSGGECGVPYERRLAMPTPAPDEPWYSFDMGPVHFLQYSTEHDFAPGSTQHEFILNDLRSVNRTVTPWVVVGGHRPFYISSTWQHAPDGDLDVASALRGALEEAFVQHGVDLTLHGHHHSYQRTCAARSGRCVPPNADGSQAAPVHLVIGHAGAGLCFNTMPQPPEMFEVVRVEHGFVLVDANATHLRCQAISNEDGKQVDEVTLFKPPQGSAAVPGASAVGQLKPLAAAAAA